MLLLLEMLLSQALLVGYPNTECSQWPSSWWEQVLRSCTFSRSVLPPHELCDACRASLMPQ